MTSLWFFGFVHIKGSLKTRTTLCFYTWSEDPGLCLRSGSIQWVSILASKRFSSSASDVGVEEQWKLQELVLSSLNLCPLHSKHANGENRGYAWAAEHLWPHDLWVLYSGKCILQLLCCFYSLVFSWLLLWHPCIFFGDPVLWFQGNTAICRSSIQTIALIKCLEESHSNARGRESKQSCIHSYHPFLALL